MQTTLRQGRSISRMPVLISPWNSDTIEVVDVLGRRRAVCGQRTDLFDRGNRARTPNDAQRGRATVTQSTRRHRRRARPA